MNIRSVFPATPKLLMALTLCLCLQACEDPNAVPGTVSNTTALDSQLADSAQRNQDSARNNLLKARTAYFQIAGQLQNVSTDVAAYRKLADEVLPAMLSVANSLTVTTATDTETTDLKADFQELFSDIMTQAMQGINNNLQIYQGQIEAPQAVDAKSATAARVLPELAALFQATEFSERFTAQLSQFASLLSNGQAVLNGIRNQQSVIINGVLQTSQQVTSQQALRSAYQTLVQTLTRPELLNQLGQLAQRAYGTENVALRTTELTAVQPDPNQVQMVVREDANHYRLIRINQSRLSNELLTDTRGLSASDWLHSSNVVVIPRPQP